MKKNFIGFHEYSIADQDRTHNIQPYKLGFSFLLIALLLLCYWLDSFTYNNIYIRVGVAVTLASMKAQPYFAYTFVAMSLYNCMIMQPKEKFHTTTERSLNSLKMQILTVLIHDHNFKYQ